MSFWVMTFDTQVNGGRPSDRPESQEVSIRLVWRSGHLLIAASFLLTVAPSSRPISLPLNLSTIFNLFSLQTTYNSYSCSTLALTCRKASLTLHDILMTRKRGANPPARFIHLPPVFVFRFLCLRPLSPLLHRRTAIQTTSSAFLVFFFSHCCGCNTIPCE